MAERLTPFDAIRAVHEAEDIIMEAQNRGLLEKYEAYRTHLFRSSIAADIMSHAYGGHISRIDALAILYRDLRGKPSTLQEARPIVMEKLKNLPKS